MLASFYSCPAAAAAFGVMVHPVGDMLFNERAGLPPNPPKKIKKAKKIT
jgi:hypothetical protein